MKLILVLFLSSISLNVFSQQLQLHYDLRHTVDPSNTKKNFPSLYFEYFRPARPDSIFGFLKPGSFLFKAQSDFSGAKNNIGQFYMQISQAVRFWKPKVYLQVQYNGGLGIAEPGSYGYYLTNAFSLGASYSFQFRNTSFFNVYASYKYTAFEKPSHDIISAFFWLCFFSNYSISLTGNVVVWTENKNHGSVFTNFESGKKFCLFSDPQIWFRLYKGLGVGSRISIYYHTLTAENKVQAYPSAGVRYQF